MLTDTEIRNAKPRLKPYKLADSNGLYLEVKPGGRKAWRYRFELVKGDVRSESLFAIGDYVVPPKSETPEQAQARRAGGLLTLAEARDARTKARALVKQGINPSHNRKLNLIKTQQDAAITFEAVAREWVSLRDWQEITKKRRLDMLTRVVFPKLGSLPVRQITPAHVLDVLTDAAKKNGITVASEAKRTMSSVFDLALATLRADSDPTYPVRKSLPANKTQHKRALDADEVGDLLTAMDSHGGRYETVTAFRLMWWTLTRPNEAVEAEWSEFDLEAGIWTIPAERMKMRRKHVIPLPTQAVTALQSMRGMSGKHVHVFPGRDNKKSFMNAASFRQALKVLGWSGRYSPHATRVTGSTRLNELSYPSDWIERQLAHAEPNSVRRTYNHADYLADRAKMMQTWADLLDEWAKSANKRSKLKS
jgi:integrase